MKESTKVLALRVALLKAVYAAEKFKETDDGGTSNMDLPTVYLPRWKKLDISEAFNLTGLAPDIRSDNRVFILRACEGQGYRRTAMAEAFCNSLKDSGYSAGVDYRMD